MAMDPLKEIHFNYLAQDGNFYQCLLVKSRLIFNNLDSNKAVGFRYPTLGNLSKSPLTKHIFDNISATQKSSKLSYSSR